MAASPVLPVYTPEQALNTVLFRPSWEEILGQEELKQAIARVFGQPLTPWQATERIVEEVRTLGDRALRSWTRRLDGLDMARFRVPPEALEQALNELDPELQAALERAARRIEAFHRSHPVTSWLTQELGGTLGMLARPLQRVGCYVPGGSAPLPSTVLMSVIPARVAGVEQVVVVTPPHRAFAHQEVPVAPVLLAACALVGVEEVYTLGGAQAIAALAYGTESIPRVDKIVGPGNIFVTLAKKMVFGTVGIDGLAGPTETVIVADDQARPDWVAADLMAQAEHDPLAAAILLTPSSALVERVQEHLAQMLPQQPRAEIIRASFRHRGGAVLTQDLDQALELANEYAPEHLALAVEDPWAWLPKVRHAGCVFLGEHSFEVLGDYLAGPNHVLPTGGTARFTSGLTVLDFVRWMGVVALDPASARTLAPYAARLAQAEGLEAHAHAARLRLAHGR